VAAIGGSDQVEEYVILRNRHQLPLAERPAGWSKAAAEHADFTDIWLSHRLYLPAPDLAGDFVPVDGPCRARTGRRTPHRIDSIIAHRGGRLSNADLQYFVKYLPRQTKRAVHFAKEVVPKEAGPARLGHGG